MRTESRLTSHAWLFVLMAIIIVGAVAPMARAQSINMTKSTYYLDDYGSELFLEGSISSCDSAKQYCIRQMDEFDSSEDHVHAGALDYFYFHSTTYISLQGSSAHIDVSSIDFGGQDYVFISVWVDVVDGNCENVLPEGGDVTTIMVYAEIPNNPPHAPSGPAPWDGESVVELDHDLSWTGGDPDGDSCEYDVYLEAGDSTPDTRVSDNQSGTSYDPGTLQGETRYYWQILSTDGNGGETWGPVWQFLTQNAPPYKPSSPQPWDGETGVDVNHDLSWTGGDPSGDTCHYDVYLEAGDSTPDTRVSDNQAGTSYDPGELAANTTYYWKILSTDDYGSWIWSDVWQFTTETPANLPPHEPSGPAPWTASPAWIWNTICRGPAVIRTETRATIACG